MRWVERIGWAALGVVLTLVAGWGAGRVTLGGDFAANVAGATIGGLISVGLAVMMFNHQRRVALADAAEADRRSWAAAVRESLRHVRAIKEAVQAGRGITINNRDALSNAITTSAGLTKRALDDPNLTDFRLRQAMEEAAQLGHSVSQTLAAQLDAAKLPDARMRLPTADDICEPVIERLDALIDDYTRFRSLPKI